MGVKLNVVFVKVNLGLFSDSDERPSMLEIQNKINSVFFDINKSYFNYKRIELLKNEKTEVELYFLYEYYKPIPDNYLLEKIEKTKKLEKSLTANISFFLISSDEAIKFDEILDDEDQSESKKNLTAYQYSFSLEKKYKP